MSDRSHDRSVPGSTLGARDGAGGLAAAAAAQAQREAAAAGTDSSAQPLPMEPGQEYVAKADHDAVVEQLTGERDAMRNDLQRIAADFENYKRRSALQREQASAAAETRLLGELLGVVDDTERAIEHAASDAADKGAVVDGLRTVHARLVGVASSHGLARIDAIPGTPFDPNVHEAMMVQPAPEGHAADTVLQEVESGWVVGERVLRHARVIVAGEGG